jgi:hypothetical protein
LKLPCRLGKVTGFGNLEEDSNFTTAAGLILNSLSSEEDGGGSLQVKGELKNKIKKIFKVFIP